MAWLQLHFHVSSTDAERLQLALDALDACAVTLTDAADEPLLEPPPGATPLWKETVVTALFEADRDADSLLESLSGQFGELPPVRREQLEDQPWERAWMDDFHPMQFGERLWIIPSWAEPPSPEAVNIRLDPGLAFGTGTHETTALCLEWLDGVNLTDSQVLDFGCGSGVLAIAALLLGAREAWACDIDPQALLATRENAEQNGVADRLRCVLADDLPGSLQCDVVLANILAGPLVELAPRLGRFCAPGGRLALSGILAEQGESVAEAYRPAFHLDPIAQRNDWVRLTGMRRD